jgi:hypothetical protein
MGNSTDDVAHGKHLRRDICNLIHLSLFLSLSLFLFSSARKTKKTEQEQSVVWMVWLKKGWKDEKEFRNHSHAWKRPLSAWKTFCLGKKAGRCICLSFRTIRNASLNADLLSCV